ncbi:hypothetical protein GPECTOR_11g169 [Gonium pectorale]|uniref:NAD-dependent epimerase/dehydratase domain-containing protein n=1 Tax=Gonium pectorale TaxID=33097 RepID=A0A150GPI6_GONPE|nr:hypothetical protein GPECTOR_11g169 [Gonium pectorale]|eukprot:KXZ51721.1 hypothetical protein GPECTOR_11g169 [Gonium pectorale]
MQVASRSSARGSAVRPTAGARRAQVRVLAARLPPNWREQLEKGTSSSSSSYGSSSSSVEPKKILMMGGTRFIGLYLARQLVEAGHEVTLFTRGKKKVAYEIPDDTPGSFAQFSRSIKHIQGDRMDFPEVERKLAREGFQVVYDINGREAVEAEPVLKGTKSTLEQYIYCSSAGVYLKNDMMPHREEDAVDPKSRHKGKLDTEELLRKSGVNFTSIRPVYIYGPLNYNPVEEWFFHRLKAGRPIPLGHVKDLATAFVKVLGNKKAARQIYNISGERFVTFDGIAKACAKAMGVPEPELIHYNAKEYDFGKDKAFPMRDQHFFTSVDKAMAELDWQPEFSLLDGLKDSYEKDFGRGTFRKEANFKCDDMILEKVKGSAFKAPAAAAPAMSRSSWR